jgi:hypothetical protein
MILSAAEPGRGFNAYFHPKIRNELNNNIKDDDYI